MSCPFCDAHPGGWHAAVIRDAYPVSDGHMLAIPQRHAARLVDLTPEEHSDLFIAVRAYLRDHPGDYTIGVNDGAAAGQTIPHVHVHLIPRCVGDVEDPTGGVRGVIPGKARWSD